MNLEQELLKAHNRKQADNIVALIDADENLFEKLIQLVLLNKPIVSQRAAWPLGIIVLANPALLTPFENDLLHLLQTQHVHDAIKRNILKVWSEQLPHENVWATLFDYCAGLLTNPKEANAARVYAMQIMTNISLQYPELKHELKLLVDAMLIDCPPSIQSRGKKVLKLLNK